MNPKCSWGDLHLIFWFIQKPILLFSLSIDTNSVCSNKHAPTVNKIVPLGIMVDSFILNTYLRAVTLKIKTTMLNYLPHYLLKVENCFEISKHIKSATEVLTNVLKPGSVNLCLSSSIERLYVENGFLFSLNLSEHRVWLFQTHWFQPR